MGREWETTPYRAWKDTKSWLQNSLWAFVISTLVGGGLGGLVIAPDGSAWFVQVGFGILGAAITIVIFIVTSYLVHLIITPHRQRNEARKDVDKLEDERVPKLIIENDISLCNHKAGYSWRLKVKNDGIDVAENCRGQLVDLTDEVPAPNWGWQRWPKNEFLSWANGDIATRIQSNGLELKAITSQRPDITIYQKQDTHSGDSPT